MNNNTRIQISFGPPKITPAVKKLIILNAVVFFIYLVLKKTSFDFFGYLGLSPEKVIYHYYVWQFFTYMFVHAGLLHILFNMLMFWMFGTELENKWGSGYFLKYYILTGMGAGLFSFVCYSFSPSYFSVPVVGASGALFGLLLAYGLYWPDRTVLLFFVIPIKMKWVLLILGAVNLLMAQSGSGDISYLTHLGGLVVGFMFLKYGLVLKNVNQQNKIRYSSIKSRNTGNKNYFDFAIDKYKMYKLRDSNEKREGNVFELEQELDQVLDKISSQGMESLTYEEKQLLKKASHLLKKQDE